jgi:hypothetical protein
VRLINNNPDWYASGAQTDEEALQYFINQSVDMVMFGGGIEPDSEDGLRKRFKELKPEITIIQHYGGGSGLLSAEIQQALAGWNS